MSGWAPLLLLAVVIALILLVALVPDYVLDRLW
jgi:hypothetical protein